MTELSPLRLNLLRLAYVLMALGLGSFMVPSLFDYTIPFVESDGVRTALFSGFAVIAIIGLRYPLKMLPLLLLEFIWKIIYLAFYYFPIRMSGQLTDTIWADGGACFMGAIFIPLFPWDYAYKEYIKKSGDRWW